MSPIYFVKQMKRDDVPLVSFTVKGLKCRYLLTLKDNLFSGSKENTYLRETVFACLFSIHNIMINLLH